jgi:hypothetical protein
MRNYRKEYDNYQGTPEQRKRRSSRNKARRKMKKLLGKKIKGKDIDHKDGNPRNNSQSNLRALSKSRNRSRK